MSGARRRFTALADFCESSAGGEEGLPEYFQLLRRCVDFDHGAFFAASESGQLQGAYHEDAQHAPQAAEFIRHEAVTAAARAFLPSIAQLLKGTPKVQLLSFDSHATRETPLYRDVIAPIGGRQVLRVGVLRGGKPLGLVALVRGPSTRGFHERDHDLLLEAAAPLTGLVDRSPAVDQERVMLSEGVMILAADASLLSACAEATRLWRLVEHRNFLPAVAGAHLLQGIVADLNRSPMHHVTHSLSNNWGKFELVATKLQGALSAVHVRLRHWVLSSIHQLKTMEDLGLSSTQKRVCRALLRDATPLQIAAELGVSRETVITHVRQVYNKASVSRRAELAQLFFPKPSASSSRPVQAW